MSRLTLGVARASLPSVCFGPGQQATADGAAPAINAACRWLFSHGKWRGTVRDVAFAVYDNQIILPRNIGTILGGGVRGVGDRSLVYAGYTVQNDWYQFLPGGPGNIVNQPYDVSGFTSAGDGFVTFRELPSVGRLKVVTTNVEAGSLEFHFRGINNGAKIWSNVGDDQIEGETMTIPQASGANVYSQLSVTSLYSITKPVTNSLIALYHVADSDGTATHVGTYEPGEQLPCYRKYFVPQREDDTDIVVARCKLKPVDVVVDNDEIIPGNLTALELALIAVNYRRKDDLQKAGHYMTMAIDELNSELEEYNAGQGAGNISIDPTLAMAGNLQ